jgi:outer membrane protein OmpA-like peptidoglycan-associated protein
MRNKINAALFLVLMLTLSTAKLFAGDGSAKKLIAKGDKQFNKSHLQKAQQYYLKALAIDSTDSYTNFQVGAIYYLSDSFKVKSLPYFLKTIKYSGPGVDDTIIDAYYYIGNCYSLMKNYTAAVAAFNTYISHIDPTSKVDETIIDEVKHNIEICIDAPGIINRSRDSTGYLLDRKLQPIFVKNLGGAINTPYAEYAQVLMNHDSTIIFTSRRPTSQKGKKDFMTDEYYEDIFISHIDSNGQWQTPSVFSSELHFSSGSENLASVTITSDGNTLFIYHNGHIWESHVQNGVWSKPSKMGRNIKQIHRYIPSVFVSFDGKKLFLVSEKEGGYGGKDIYESDKNSDGTWSNPQNLGPTINTSYDEDSPFLLPDNKTLYFSSKGHPGLGGYDVFKSVYENGQWSTPINLGTPINSSADDIYFTYDTAVKKGFFSSSRINQGYGNMDIYTFSFQCENIENTVLHGEIVANGKPVQGAAIILTDTRRHGKTFTTTSGEDGGYSVSLKPEHHYSVLVKVPGYLPYTTSVSTPHQCDAYNLYQLVNTNYITDSLYVHTGQTLSVKNAFYRDVKPTGYKNAMNDPALSSFIRSFKDTTTIWERDTTATIAYTPVQKDSINPKTAIAINTTDTAIRVVKAVSIPKMPVVYFAFNKYSINKAYYSKLDSLAKYVRLNSKCKIQIEGNTDTRGSFKYNQHLSLLRARAVAGYLIRKGVASSRIHIQGNGKHHLAVVGDGASALNRRDDIIIIQ